MTDPSPLLNDSKPLEPTVILNVSVGEVNPAENSWGGASA
jgi:hypothetical protein